MKEKNGGKQPVTAASCCPPTQKGSGPPPALGCFLVSSRFTHLTSASAHPEALQRHSLWAQTCWGEQRKMLIKNSTGRCFGQTEISAPEQKGSDIAPQLPYLFVTRHCLAGPFSQTSVWNIPVFLPSALRSQHQANEVQWTNILVSSGLPFWQ